MIKVIKGKFLVTLLVLSCYGTEIEELFKKYKEVTEISKKTRQEALGHYVVYTREDIERMGAYRLIDLLRSAPYMNILPNLFGFSNGNLPGTYLYVPSYVKVYINDHEISSLYFGSPFVVWEDIPLDNINHVEIYYFSGATSLGNEPAVIIIKMYTKSSKSEGILLSTRFGIDSRGNYDGSFLITKSPTKDLSYILMLNQRLRDRKDIFFNGNNIKRDSLNRYIYIQVKYKDTTVEFGEGHINRYPFMGLSFDRTPSSGKLKISERYLQITQNFLKDKSLKLQFSVDNNYRDYFEKNNEFVYIPTLWDFNNPLNNPVFYYENINFFKYTAFLKKDFKSKKNKLSLAFNYKNYDYRIRNRSFITAEGKSRYVTYITPFNKESVYSFILQDEYNLSSRNLILFDFRYDVYRRNGGFKDFKEYVLRLGYVSVPINNLYFKAFAQRFYQPPYFYHIDFSGEDLDVTEIPYYISSELNYRIKYSAFGVITAYAKIKDGIFPNENLIFENYRTDIYPYFLGFYYTFEKNSTKLILNYFKVFNFRKFYSPREGGYIRFFHSHRRFDFYSELIFRKGIRVKPYDLRLKNSYLLNVSFRYRLGFHKSVVLKGQNILNRDISYPFLDPISNSVIRVQPSDRVVSITFEYYM